MNEKDPNDGNFTILNIAIDDLYRNQAIVMIRHHQLESEDRRTIVKIPFFSIRKDQEFEIPPICNNWKFTMRDTTPKTCCNSMCCMDGKVFVWRSGCAISIFDFQCGELLGIIELSPYGILKYFNIIGDNFMAYNRSCLKVTVYDVKFSPNERFYKCENTLSKRHTVEIWDKREVTYCTHPIIGEDKEKIRFALTEECHIYDFKTRFKFHLYQVTDLFHFDSSRMELFAHNSNTIYIIQDKKEMDLRKRSLFFKSLGMHMTFLTDLIINFQTA